MPYSNDPHLKAMVEAALGKTANPQGYDVKDITQYTRTNTGQGGLPSSPTLIPAPTGPAQQITPQPGLPGAWDNQQQAPQRQSQKVSHHQSNPFQFQPDQVAGLLSLDEIGEHVKRLADTKYDPQITNLQNQLEQDQLQGEHQKADIGAFYDKAQQDLQQAGRADHRQGADIMRNRGIYDSGLAMHLSSQIQRDIRHKGIEVSTEQARALSEVAEVLAQRHNQTNEQMQELIANKSTEAQSLLWELTREERDFRQQAQKDQFMMWLEQEKLQTDQKAMVVDDYWRERGYDFDFWRASIDDWKYVNDFEYKVHADGVVNAFKDREYQLQVDMFNNQITVDQFKMQMDQARFELEKQIAEWASRT